MILEVKVRPRGQQDCSVLISASMLSLSCRIEDRISPLTIPNRTCCICDHERRGRTSDSVQAAVNVDAWGRVYCSDVISASQVEQLMDSLQHIVATDDDDDEVAYS